MNDGWEASAEAWMAEIGEHGDFSRRYVLDPVMLPRALARSPREVLDVGCGEGRFCRLLRDNGVLSTGIDPTPSLISAARARDVNGNYCEARAEHLPFQDASFDLIISYLSLIDIADMQGAIREVVRVLQPGGTLLIANLNSFNTACGDTGWIRDKTGRRLFYPIDHYLRERAMRIEYRGIRIMNYHRPMSAYLGAFLHGGLRLVHFDEPVPVAEAPAAKAESYRRVPWFVVMEWLKAV